MKVIVTEVPIAADAAEADLDGEVADRLQSVNVLTAFWSERDDGFVVTVVRAGPEMIAKAAQLGADPRDLVDRDSLDAALAALGGSPQFGSAGGARLGVLSEEYESRGDPGAIGFDSTGGHSYGLYQLASRKGRVAGFLAFLARTRPAMAETLEQAGGDAAARRGDAAFKQAWKALARDEPEFAAAQHGFIKSTHYDPFCARVAGQCGFDVNARSEAVRNVAWSTAVQHGPHNNVFRNALGANAGGLSDADIVDKVYDERSKVDVYFRSSTPNVQASVRNRFQRERADAHAMLA